MFHLAFIRVSAISETQTAVRSEISAHGKTSTECDIWKKWKILAFCVIFPRQNRTSMLTSDLALYSILGVILLENSVEIYLNWRQIRVYKTARKIPRELDDVITEETFHKARVYGLDKEEFNVIQSIVMQLFIVPLELYLGFFAYVWALSEDFTSRLLDSTSEIYVSCMFVLVLTVISTVKALPFKVYRTFVLEERHGFNKQTPGFFVKDQVKSFVVASVISLPIVAAVVAIVQSGGDYFFVWLWLFTSAVTLLLMTLYPSLIAPLFDKYRPLDEGPLRKSIEELAASLKFPLKQLYVVEGSKRSAHSNAYFYGLWGSKRIVLFDTLLLNKGAATDEGLAEEEKGRGCEDSEVLAVLGHELGHWKLGHITKNLVIMQVHLFLLFSAFAWLFRTPVLYQALGFPVGVQPVLIGLLVVFTYVLAPYNAVINFAMTTLSRRFEYQADAFAQKLGFATELGKALVKLNVDNLGFPVYDWLYSAWNHSHPTLLQRLDALKKKTK
ncbi:CAAX prenyl protease 1 homolog [Phlebotomus argentipes]|uniref:CAAX prenyl protease 1 homolog n=1 Tax=Phlebotomus argentipes TaxID=94469 RepID=UPI00289330E4|nr:CAAX prenyl protease 1 homolog [Phlebotomus argentipes]